MSHHSDHKVAAICASALLRFSQQGVDRTYMKEIAQDAGVRESTIYYHFDGKEGILQALARTYQAKRAQLFFDQFCASRAVLAEEEKITTAWLLDQLQIYIDFFVNLEDARFERIVEL